MPRLATPPNLSGDPQVPQFLITFAQVHANSMQISSPSPMCTQIRAVLPALACLTPCASMSRLSLWYVAFSMLSWRSSSTLSLLGTAASLRTTCDLLDVYTEDHLTPWWP